MRPRASVKFEGGKQHTHSHTNRINRVFFHKQKDAIRVNPIPTQLQLCGHGLFFKGYPYLGPSTSIGRFVENVGVHSLTS